jgi:aspartate ammonia-lyase
VVQNLQKLTGLPVTKSDNLSDATSNLDSLVEVHAILKSHAVNLEKMVSDIRLLASDLVNIHELSIPKKQIGSTIMPGKVNPVIPEFIISAAHKIYSNDVLISSLAAQGCLELNAYLPVIGTAMIESLQLMIAANESLGDHLLQGLTIDEKTARENLVKSPSVATALVPYAGYKAAAALAREMKENNIDIFTANEKIRLIDPEILNQIMSPSYLLKEGFTMEDMKLIKSKTHPENMPDSL